MTDAPFIPAELYEARNAPLLTGILRGIEREALRVNTKGGLALSPHPEALGSALTHPRITTDFSEALLEFITQPNHRVEGLFEQLTQLHAFASAHLGDEILWANSMPCSILADDQIPVAKYGDSNNGRMKTVYRIGLGHRYGRTMQTVSGLHYNFSLPNAFWAFFSGFENSSLDLQEFKNQKYFALIRNFRRYYWLLIYLFGASPAICRSFARDKKHELIPFDEDDHTLHAPYATSLRMGNLGYQSSAQESLFVCYNQQRTYIESLCCAIVTKHENYEHIGVRDCSTGEYRQLNTSLLQIENEFYSAIRPKRTAKPGETALSALKNRGVEYIEVRCIDVNPFSPVGITMEQVYFLDTFLVFCALLDSPETDRRESDIILANQKTTVMHGRKPDIALEHPHDGKITLRDWAMQLSKAMEPVAELLDRANGGEMHQRALSAQAEKILKPKLTPSAQLLQSLRDKQQTFQAFSLAQSRENFLRVGDEQLSINEMEKLSAMAAQSHADQAALESQNKRDFETFLREYYEQYNYCKKCQET